MARNYPWTSHAAAQSVTNKPAKEEAILTVLRKPMTDEQMIVAYRNLIDSPWASDSGLRTLRSKLVKEGLVVDTGIVQETRSGRNSIVWRTK
jgi:hypothetical protein